MELFRVILVVTGVLLLGAAYLVGRKKTKINVYNRAQPDGYDPSLDELSVPLTDVAPAEGWQSDHEVDSALESSAEPDNTVDTVGASSMVFDADAELSDDEIDAALPSTGDYSVDPVQTEIEISKEFDDIDLDMDIEEATERADVVKVTSLASAVKLSSNTDGTDAIDKNFSEEFQSYSQDFSEGGSEDFGEPVQLEHFEEKLVTVHVAAQNDRRFYGSDIKALFDLHGYTYGRMSIYHCALDGDKVFSIANMVKPGTFDDEQMTSFETPGLTLFMRLPIELDADVAFDFLITEAKGLAEELGGHLRDENRNPLSEQTIQHMREDIQQYLFRSKRPLHTT